MPSEACFSMAVWQREVRPEEEVLGRKRPRSDLGSALTVSLAWGKETLHSTFVSLVALAGSSEVSRGTQEAATRGVAWRGVTPLPASPGNSLASCLNLSFPARPFALAWVLKPSDGLGCITASVLTEPSSRSCLLLEGHILSGPCLLSARMVLPPVVSEWFPVLLRLWGRAPACKAMILYFCTRKQS